MSGEKSIQFSLVSGGPFHKMLAHFGLLGPDWLPTWRTAFVLALLAWAPPAILAIAQSLLHASRSLVEGILLLLALAGLIRPASWPVYSE